VSERLLRFRKSVETYEGHSALILGLGKFRPQLNCPFIQGERPGNLSFSMSVLAALKKLHRICFAVGRIFCLGAREWKAHNNKQQDESPKV
jgi:hypothetical protein